MSILFDLNKRADLILRNFSPNISERIVSIALPFLSLNSTTASLASAGIGAYESYHLFQKVRENKDATSLARLVIVVSSTVLGIVSPLGQFIVSNSVMLVVHINELFQNKGWVKKVQAILKIADQAIHVGSIYYGSPRWIVLSLLSQICSELYQAQNFVRKQGKWPEAFAHLTLAGIRSYKTHSLLFSPQEKQIASLASILEQAESEKPKQDVQKIETLVQEKPSILIPEQAENIKLHQVAQEIQTIALEIPSVPFPEQTTVIKERPLTQAEWERIYYSLDWRRKSRGEKTNIELILEQQGISKHIEGIDFKKTYQLNDLYFKNLHLNKCDFTGAELKRSIFENVHADSCLFKNSCWIGSIVQNSFFDNCNFKSAALVRARLDTLRFTHCYFTRTAFNESTITHSSFVQSKLLETSFLHTTVDQGKLINSDLTDALLLDTKEHFDILGSSEHRITRPVVAMGWNFKDKGIFTPMIAKALRDNGIIPLYYNQKLSNVDPKLLDAEIVAGMKDLKDVSSIPQELLKRATKGSQIGKVRQKAAEILKHCHGHVLPGGDDIEPEFYGEKIEFLKKFYESEKKIPPPEDMLLSMLEFALIEHSHKNKIPTMGICRGAQMINVYFGGTLHQHVEGQEGYHTMEFMDSPQAEWLPQLMQGKFVALSMHHQAVKKIGQGLHPLLKRGDVIKFLVSEDGTFIASQIHPEDYVMMKKNFKGKETIPTPFFRFNNKVNGKIEIVKVRISLSFSKIRKKLLHALRKDPAAQTTKNFLLQVLQYQINKNSALNGLSTVDHLQNNKNIYQYFVQKTQAAFKPAEKA